MIKLGSYIWRLVATGFCFALFGLGGLILSLIVFPMQRLIYRDAQVRKKKARLTVHYTFRMFVNVMGCSGAGQFKVENKQRLAGLKGQLVLANHPSLIDVVVLISVIPNADCVVKGHLFRNPFMRGVINSTGYISNDNPDALIEDCKQSLAEGNNLIIFPEGTRTRPGERLKFQRGAANIAVRCQANLTGVIINVTPSTLTKAENWYNIPERRFEFSIRLSHELPRCLYDSDQPDSLISRQFTRELERYFNQEVSKI